MQIKEENNADYTVFCFVVCVRVCVCEFVYFVEK